MSHSNQIVGFNKYNTYLVHVCIMIVERNNLLLRGYEFQFSQSLYILMSLYCNSSTDTSTDPMLSATSSSIVKAGSQEAWHQ
jgi:hypothetical protein